jgi:hypothetical protein
MRSLRNGATALECRTSLAYDARLTPGGAAMIPASGKLALALLSIPAHAYVLSAAYG